MEGAPLPNKLSITLTSDKGNKYEIYFTNVDNLLLITTSKLYDKNVIYQEELQLNEIRKIKYFSICDSIYDVLITLNSNLSNKDIKLCEKNEELLLTIPLNHPLTKEIVFNLKLTQNKESENLVHKLYDIVKLLIVKVDTQQKEIEQLKSNMKLLEERNQEELNILKVNIHELMEKNSNNQKDNNGKTYHKISNNYHNNQIDNKGKTYYKISNNFHNNLIDTRGFLEKASNLIKNEIEEKSIKNWINGLSRPIKFKLLFRMSQHGTKALDFHHYCDSQGKTLILIETMDGKRLGGYTSLQWNIQDGKKYGDNVWLFTFQKMLYKIPLINVNKLGAIICEWNYGPSFDEALIIKDNNLTQCYIENKRLLCDFPEKSLKIKELEVFQVYIKYN